MAPLLFSSFSFFFSPVQIILIARILSPLIALQKREKPNSPLVQSEGGTSSSSKAAIPLILILYHTRGVHIHIVLQLHIARDTALILLLTILFGLCAVMVFFCCRADKNKKKNQGLRGNGAACLDDLCMVRGMDFAQP